MNPHMIDSISEYLTNPSDLPVNGVVIGVDARRPLVAGHVHTHDVQMLWEVLGNMMDGTEVTQKTHLKETFSIPQADRSGSFTVPRRNPDLDHGEPGVLVSGEAVKHQNGRSRPWLSSGGVTEAVSPTVCKVNLQAQSPPPVPEGATNTLFQSLLPMQW